MSHAAAAERPCRRLYLIRHGETLYGGDRDGVFRGGDLTEEGYRQIEVLAELFGDVRLDAIYASPLERARATAETIARRNGTPVTIVPALREIEPGDIMPGDIMGQEMAQIFTAVRAFFASRENQLGHSVPQWRDLSTTPRAGMAADRGPRTP